MKLQQTFSALLVAMSQLLFSSAGHAANESTIDFLELTAVPAQKIVHFKWLVNREAGGNSFLIEKSTDRRKWSRVAEVPSLANHADLHAYQLSEINLPESATEYFRLTRIDQDGQSQILDETFVSHPILSGMILIPPSKAERKEVIATCNALVEMQVRVQLLNSKGVLLSHEMQTLRVGYNRIVVDIRDLPRGTYILMIRDNKGNQQARTFSTLRNEKDKKGEF